MDNAQAKISGICGRRGRNKYWNSGMSQSTHLKSKRVDLSEHIGDRELERHFENRKVSLAPIGICRATCQ